MIDRPYGLQQHRLNGLHYTIPFFCSGLKISFSLKIMAYPFEFAVAGGTKLVLLLIIVRY